MSAINVSDNARNLITRAVAYLQRIAEEAASCLALRKKARAIARHCSANGHQPPVLIFQASSGVARLTLNRAFSLLTAWILRLSGVPVIQMVCRRGMKRCVMGTNNRDLHQPPPCPRCLRLERAIHSGAWVHFFDYQEDTALAQAIRHLSIPQLTALHWPAPPHWALPENVTVPLGALVLPSMRWILRRHNLLDDEPTRTLYREYLLSAWSIGQEFVTLLARIHPQAIVLFNGQFFPEAIVAWIARQRGLRVITHEVGLRPFSAFFCEGEATAYPIEIPHDFELSEAQNARLDAYLEQRFRGQFTMAGIRFWPEMKGLDEAFLQRASHFKQIVPVFTNVIFDTSQPHSNVIFPDMFAWLDEVLDIIRTHPETLFVLRAHPDEERPHKESRESVAMWVEKRNATALPNLMFVGARQYISSYELIQRSKFVMIYNSTIGLEASILGTPVLCAGQARFTRYPTVFFPPNREAFRAQAEEFLRAEHLEAPSEHRRQARRFLYYQLFRVSLPFDAYLENGSRPGTVTLRRFDWRALLPEHSPAAKTLLEGVLAGKPFVLEE